jgi:hypothetical protein
MNGKIHRYLAGDHARLDRLLERAIADPGHIDPEAYAQFRSGLLKHIAMEEKVLFPAAQKRRGEPLALTAKLRLDHGALVALLVPPPAKAIVAAIRGILERHNPIEEGDGGIYDECERLVETQADEVLEQLQHYPEIKVLPHVDNPFVIEAARRALARAGYDLQV